MSLTDRDRKILLGIAPLLLLVVYWFILLAPKRQEAGKLGDQLARQEAKRDAAEQKVAQLNAAKDSFAKDYATVVKLGKAIPTSVDMASLIVQLESAAKGTGIDFARIKAGQRQSASTATSTAGSTSSASSGSSSSSTPASSAGGQTASTGPGQAAEKANNTKAAADSSATQAGGSSAGASSTSSSGSGAGAGTTPTSGASMPGLDSVPLEFTFSGGFFELADFFHQLKRFVHVANERISVRGRLMTINGFNFKASAFPRLEAQVFATVYLTPKSEGSTAGATQSGPAPAPSGGSSSTPASSGSPPAPSAPPAAVSTR